MKRTCKAVSTNEHEINFSTRLIYGYKFIASEYRLTDLKTFKIIFG